MKTMQYILILIFFLCSTELSAGAWVLLNISGEKPNRIATYADANDRRDLTDPAVKVAEVMKDHNPKTIEERVRLLRQIDLKVVQVFENPNAPAFMQLKMSFNCGKQKLYKINEAEAIARNKVPHMTSRPEWKDVPSNGWINRAHFIACDENIWYEAARSDFDYMIKQPKNRDSSKLKLPAYGIIAVGDWVSNEYASGNIAQFTWDTSFKDGTYVPMNNNRTTEEEKIYQKFQANNSKIREENKKVAGKLDNIILGLEGQLKAMDEESKFQEEISNNFRKHKSKYFGTFKGLTEEQLVDVRGVPTSSSINGNLKSIVYAYTTDNRQEVNIHDGKGNLVGKDVVGQILQCDVTFKLRIGGNRSEYRVVDYKINQDITSQGFAKCD